MATPGPPVAERIGNGAPKLGLLGDDQSLVARAHSSAIVQRISMPAGFTYR